MVPFSLPTSVDTQPPLRSARQAAVVARHIVPTGKSGVVVLLLDDGSWPIGSFVIDGASGRTPLLQAADLVARVAVDSPHLAKAVLIDVRQGGGNEDLDLDVLLEATTMLDALGVALVELVVLTPDMYVPVSALAGLPSLW